MRRIKEYFNLIIFSPFFNEEETLTEFLNNILEIYTQLKHRKIALIMVDDGSTDKSAKLIKVWKEENKARLRRRKFLIEIINNPKNKGKGYSVRIGFKHVLRKYHFDYLLTIDSDMEIPPINLLPYLKKLNYNKLEKNKLILIERNKPRTTIRGILTRVGDLMISRVTSYPILRFFSGCFIFSEGNLKRLIPKLTADHFEIETEIILESYKLGFQIRSIPVELGKVTRSKMNIKHMLEITYFFSDWTIKNRKTIKRRFTQPILILFLLSIRETTKAILNLSKSRMKNEGR